LADIQVEEKGKSKEEVSESDTASTTSAGLDLRHEDEAFDDSETDVGEYEEGIVI
jgi:hypothetical protein